MLQAVRTPISMSVFDLLKAGPGPSSSHTIGPMRAGLNFVRLAADLPLEIVQKAQGVRVRLLGSLSATGRGHGTDRAVLAGLMGYDPTTCSGSLLNELFSLPKEKQAFHMSGKSIPIGEDNIEYGPIQHSYPYSNTLLIDLLDVPYALQFCTTPSGTHLPVYSEAEPAPDAFESHILLSREYYSVGGGFLQWKGWEPETVGAPKYPYVNMKELHVRLVESGLSLDELMMENEMAITGATAESITAGLDALLVIMKETVERGSHTKGLLPGPIGLSRKAGVLFERADSLQSFDKSLCLLNSYAYAAAEENAAGNIIVTAPTCGAAGVMPAVTVFMQKHLGVDIAAQRKGLLAAAAIGFIAKQNAGIAGAEVGCQGEVGVASAMSAAMLAQARGYSPRVVENAAEIALEHHLGLTCDPVGGFVQIPCIERNAVGAVKAYNAALIACNENPAAHLVSYDDVLAAMAEIGRDMNQKYKETSTGGLAVCMVAC